MVSLQVCYSSNTVEGLWGMLSIYTLPDSIFVSKHAALMEGVYVAKIIKDRGVLYCVMIGCGVKCRQNAAVASYRRVEGPRLILASLIDASATHKVLRVPLRNGTRQVYDTTRLH